MAEMNRHGSPGVICRSEALTAGQERCPDIAFGRNLPQNAILLLRQERYGARRDAAGIRRPFMTALFALTGSLLNFTLTGMKRV